MTAPLATARVSVPQVDDSDIARLLENACQQGERDAFRGKRQSARYHLGAPLEITTDVNQPSATRSVVMHNVSEGGIGFWSREPLSPNTVIFVRDWRPEKSTSWVPARVKHSTLGISGHLIGAAFQEPPGAGTARPVPVASRHRNEPQASDPPPPRGATGSLRTKCVGAAAVAAGVGAALGSLICQHVHAELLGRWVTLASAGLAFALGGLGAWAGVEASVRFLERLCHYIRQVGSSAAMPPLWRKAPCKELGSVLAVLADLTARWKTREDDERAQRNKLEELNLIRSNILNMVSHDLRTPLTSIRLYSEMLTEELKTLAEEDQRRFLQVITDECKRLSRLVDDLLEAQRLEAGRVKWDMRPQDLSKLVRACALVFEPMARSKSIELQVDCSKALPAVEADADRISQVLSNLVSNALKYTQNGGTVNVSARASADEVLICVADNGPGIPRDQWDQIFDRFARISVSFVREVSGVGLGLFIVRQIVARHGGRVWVDSEVGKGSAFYVALPREAAPESAGVHHPEVPDVGRVVVCDADPELVNRIVQKLRREHYNVRAVYSGCRLLAQILETHPDVVVSDVLLPDMNSADILTSLSDLRQRHPFRLVVHTYVGDSRELRRRGADVVLSRPAKPEELVQAVAVALQKRVPSGLTVLLFCHPRVDAARLCRLLMEAGHIPLPAETVGQAMQIARGYPMDAIVVSEETLDSANADLLDALTAAQPHARVVVLVERVGRSQRRGAAAGGYMLVVYARGREEELVATVAAQRASLSEETAP